MATTSTPPPDHATLTIWQKTSTHYLLLIVIGALLFIPFLGNVHLYDWDELNFAEASREMLISGNFMRVTIDFQPFWEKPPLFFWMQSASMNLFGVNEFAARFVNALIGIITLLVVYTIGRRRFDKTFGLAWALAFACSFLPHVFFKSGIIDPTFNLFIFLGFTFASSVVLHSDRKGRLRFAALAGLFIGLAILSKGPVALIVFGLTFSVYWATTKCKPLFSIAEIALFTVTMVGVSALFYGIETALHGPWFVTEFLKYQIRLLRTGDAGHGRPFYFHFLVLLFGCFPASFFAIRSFKRDDGYSEPQQLFNRLVITLFWVTLILFSIVKTKTVLYSSLCWYPITYLGALHARRLITGKVQWNKWLHLSFIVFTVLVGIAITAFPLLLRHKELIMPLIRDKFAVACMQKPVVWTGWESLIGILFLGIAVVSFILIAKRKTVSGLIALFIASVLCVQLTLLIINPKIEQYTQSDPVAFYKQHSGKDEYVRSLFKSYADLFYGKKRIDDHPMSHDFNWLLTGPIDKPVFFVGRIQQEKKFGKPELGLTLIERKYGFIYYRRDPEPVSAFALR